jgi:hypothetical protein
MSDLALSDPQANSNVRSINFSPSHPSYLLIQPELLMLPAYQMTPLSCQTPSYIDDPRCSLRCFPTTGFVSPEIAPFVSWSRHSRPIYTDSSSLDHNLHLPGAEKSHTRRRHRILQKPSSNNHGDYPQRAQFSEDSSKKAVRSFHTSYNCSPPSS